MTWFFLITAMPEMDGMEVLKEIKNLDANAFVIFMTGEGSEDVAVTAMKSGAVDYLTKPISYLGLAHLAGKWIKEHDLLLENIKFESYFRGAQELYSQYYGNPGGGSNYH